MDKFNSILGTLKDNAVQRHFYTLKGSLCIFVELAEEAEDNAALLNQVVESLVNHYSYKDSKALADLMPLLSLEEIDSIAKKIYLKHKPACEKFLENSMAACVYKGEGFYFTYLPDSL